MTNPTWIATDDSIDAWDAVEAPATYPPCNIDWNAADRAADERASFLADLQEDARRAAAWW